MKRVLPLLSFATTALATMRGAAETDQREPDMKGTVPDAPAAVVETRATLGDDPSRPIGRFSLLIHSRVGVAETPFAATSWPEQTGYRVFSFVPQVSYALYPAVYLGLRIPVVEAFIERPAGSIVKEAALGNIELSASWRSPLMRRLQSTLRFSIAAPSEGNVNPASDHYTNAALALGSALEGWRAPELFAPGRLPLTPSASIDYHVQLFHAGVELKLPLLVQIQASSADEAVRVNPVAFSPVLVAHASVNPFRSLYLTARGWAAWRAVEPAEHPAHSPSAVQIVVQPEVSMALGDHFTVGLDALLPIGGELGGKAYSGALTLGAYF